MTYLRLEIFDLTAGKPPFSKSREFWDPKPESRFLSQVRLLHWDRRYNSAERDARRPEEAHCVTHCSSGRGWHAGCVGRVGRSTWTRPNLGSFSNYANIPKTCPRSSVFRARSLFLSNSLGPILFIHLYSLLFMVKLLEDLIFTWFPPVRKIMYNTIMHCADTWCRYILQFEVTSPCILEIRPLMHIYE